MSLEQEELQRLLFRLLMGADLAREALPGMVARLGTPAGRAAAVELLVRAAGGLGRQYVARILEGAAARLRGDGDGAGGQGGFPGGGA